MPCCQCRSQTRSHCGLERRLVLKYGRHSLTILALDDCRCPWAIQTPYGLLPASHRAAPIPRLARDCRDHNTVRIRTPVRSEPLCWDSNGLWRPIYGNNWKRICPVPRSASLMPSMADYNKRDFAIAWAQTSLRSSGGWHHRYPGRHGASNGKGFGPSAKRPSALRSIVRTIL